MGTKGLGQMSVSAPQIEWYIARDGAQHGPISDVEMHKFVELGHLRAVDLVWCAHFTEWVSGAQAFPEHFKPNLPVQLAAPEPAPQASINKAPQASIKQAPQGSVNQALQPSATQTPAPSPAMVPLPSAASSAASWTGAQPGNSRAQPNFAGPQSAGQAVDESDWAAAMRSVIQPDVKPHVSYDPAPAAPSYHLDPIASSQPLSHPHQAPLQPGSAPGTALRGRDHEPDEYVDDTPPRRGWLGRIAAIAAVLLIVSGLGWIGWQNRSMISGASAIGSMITAKMSSAAPQETYRAPPYEALGETRDLIDVSLQKSAVWRSLKRDFGDWYGERLVDIERMRTQKQDEKVISKFLADVIVTLRRRNAQIALQSSPEHLRGMASAFVLNLKQLASRDGQTCFGFISFGEANPFMLELSRTPAFAETLQKQLTAVFTAVADGRANRQVHAATRRSDYDTLTQELTTRGWTQQDLATFSDPQKLSASPPEKVCNLVQEWFTAQLGLKDTELQTRLLSESLKPLVGG